MLSSKNGKNKKSYDAKPAVWHFPGNEKIESDVLGSYTGTCTGFNGPVCEEDLYPVQDADDL